MLTTDGLSEIVFNCERIPVTSKNVVPLVAVKLNENLAVCVVKSVGV